MPAILDKRALLTGALATAAVAPAASAREQSYQVQFDIPRGIRHVSVSVRGGNSRCVSLSQEWANRLAEMCPEGAVVTLTITRDLPER